MPPRGVHGHRRISSGEKIMTVVHFSPHDGGGIGREVSV
jgi:hypothetical protein